MTTTAAIIGDDAEADRYTAIPPRASASHEAADDARRAGRWDVEGTIGRARTDVYDTAVRLRLQIAPHAAVGATVGTGLALDAVVAGGGIAPGSAALMAAAASAATVGAIVARARQRGSEWVRRLLFGGAGAGLWLTAAPYGVGVGDAAVLVAAEYALAARWWQAHRPGYPGYSDDIDELDTDVVPEPGDIPNPLTPVEQIIADWEEHIACSGGPLQNSRLIAPQEHEHGFAFTLQLWRGRQTLATALAALDKIAGGLGYGVDALVIEKHPAFMSTATCRFQLITRSPIAGDVTFTGPRRHGGLLELGPYADGDGDAQWRLYTPGSMWSGFILGGSGMGKSRLLENIVISAMSAGDTEYWFIDPQGGASSPLLRDHADWFVNEDSAEAVLDAALAILKARSEENAVEGWTGFVANPRRPGLLIVIDECHNIFKVRTNDWARIAREGRKVGIAILCVSQYSGLDTFGGADVLRSSVMLGNAIALYVQSNHAQSLMPGLDVDPKTLPMTAGYCYLQGNDSSELRTAPFRNRDTAPAGDQSRARAAMTAAVANRPGLEPLAITATKLAGAAYTERHANAASGHAAAAARVEALRNGHVPADMLRGTPEQAAVPLAQVVQFPQFRLVENTPTNTGEPSAMGLPVEGLTPSQQAVLDAVTAGATRPAEIEQAVGLGHRRVAALLKELTEAGHLTKPSYGRYQRAA